MTREYIRHHDSDGVEHLVDVQNEPMSCALASLGMAWDMSRLQCNAAGESGYKKMALQFPGSLLASQLQGDNHGLGDGTTVGNVAQMMGRIGLRISTYDSFVPASGNFGFNWQKSRIRSRSPAILLVGWYRNNAQGQLERHGGHFVVAARTTRRSSVVILDPADGGMRELWSSSGHYNAHNLRGMIQYVLYTG